MAIQCPYCKHGMSAKDAKPGRYKPKCSKCGQRFVLTIYAEAGREPLAEPLPADPTAVTVAAPAPQAPPQKSSPGGHRTVSPDDTLTHEKTVAVPADATLPFDSGKTAVQGSTATVIAETMVPTSTTSALQATGMGIEATQIASHNAPTRHGLDATAVTRPAPTAHSGVVAVERSPNLPEKIGGYKILKELGRGAMGAVYLAKQLSLDRDVALKTIQAQWAQNPTFIARFTREAYAAAQLTHHNVVQIYDLGVDGQSNYFSMEFVRGQSLDELIRHSGPLAPELAVGYVLQAARGLRFAHQHGMVHRDIKPANMMLNDQGIVKIADLGLVKLFAAEPGEERTHTAASAGELAVARADVTTVNVAMGTPAYMAPEQADNAAGVDHRADIYSLGCSLYVMLTGKPPFEGISAIEVITKHRTAPVVRPDLVVKGIPKELADITLRMVAKQPDQRYQNLDEVIRDLERFVAVPGEKPGPTEEQRESLRESAVRFNHAPFARIRGVISGGFIAGTIILAAVLCLMKLELAFACVALAASAALSYFVTSGIRERSPLFDRARAVLLSQRWTDWLQFAAGGLVVLLALWLAGWLIVSIVAIVIGTALGIAYWALVDRRLAVHRQEVVTNVENLLRQLRRTGSDETALQSFVASSFGQDWEELFETLFGYDAKLEVRRQLSQSIAGTKMRRFRGWRDPIVRHFDARIKANREVRDRRYLQQLEEKNLRAQGLEPDQARDQAGRIASALVEEAAAVRTQVVQPAQAFIDPSVAAAEKRERIKRMLAEAKSGTRPRKMNPLGPVLAPVRFALSGRVRFLLGCLLIAGCALWAKQNQFVSTDGLRSAAQDISQNLQGSELKNLSNAVKLQTGTPLNVPIVGKYFDSWFPGIAGLMLVVLGMFRGWKMSLFALPAAAAIVIGPAFGPRVVMLLIGLVVGGLGLFFGRSPD